MAPPLQTGEKVSPTEEEMQICFQQEEVRFSACYPRSRPPAKLAEENWRCFCSLPNLPCLYHNSHDFSCPLSLWFNTWMSVLITSSPYIVLYVIKSTSQAGCSTQASVLLGILTVSTPSSVLMDLSTLGLKICTSHARISLENIIFLQRLSCHVISLEVPLPVAVFDGIHYKHLGFGSLLLSTYLTFHIDLWQCKWFQPLISICSLPFGFLHKGAVICSFQQFCHWHLY